MPRFRVILRVVTVTTSQITKSSTLLVISAIVASLASCAPAPESTSVQTSPASSSSSVAQAASPQVAIPGVQNSKQIIFKKPIKNSTIGFFEGVNDSAKFSHKLPKTKPFVVLGWAVSSDYKSPADLVLITAGESNTPITIAQVKLNRPDVAKALKNQALAKSGWMATINPSSLSSEKVVLKAWAYNPKTREATLLRNSQEIFIQ